MTRRIRTVFLMMMLALSFIADAFGDNCITLNQDLSMSIPCATHNGTHYGFSLIPRTDLSEENSSGPVWQASEVSIHDASYDCGTPLEFAEDLSLTVTCADYARSRMQFKLIPHGEPKDLLWTIDLNSIGKVNSGFDLTIIHMNDTHSHIEGASGQSILVGGTSTYVEMGGYARMTTKIKEIRAASENTLLLHAGDAVQGTLYFSKYEGEADFAFLNAMGVDAMCVGNHEFDKGPEYLEKFFGYADFPIVSANIDDSADTSLSGKIAPYAVKEFNGEKVAVIGLTTPATETVSSPGDNILFTNTALTLAGYVAEVEAMGINKIIVLSHQGYEADMALGRIIDGVDIIVGGHSHTLLGGEALSALGKSPAGAYPTVVKNSAGENVYVVQAWQHAMALGNLHAVFDKEGVVTGIEGTPIILIGDESIRQKDADGNKVEVDAETRSAILSAINENTAVEVVEEDAAAKAALASYKAGVEEMQSRVIASVSSNLYHTRIPFTDKYGDGVPLPYGSYIAPVVCDAMLWKAKQVGLAADFALQNAGGVRKSIGAGDLTVGDAYELMPFGNTLVVLSMTGARFIEAIKGGVDAATGGKSSGAFPYVGGCRFTVDAKTSPEAPVLTAVEMKDALGNWIAIDEAATYRVVTPSYIAGGGDYYEALKEAPGYRYDTGFVDAEVFMDYAAAMKTLNRPDATGVTWLTDSIVLKMIETTDVHASLFPYDFIEAGKIDHSLAQVYYLCKIRTGKGGPVRRVSTILQQDTTTTTPRPVSPMKST